MNARTHRELANFIWEICNLLRGPYKRNEYRKVILPLTVLRRFDCVLAETKPAVLAAHKKYSAHSGKLKQQLLQNASGQQFYNTSELDFRRLLDDPNHLARNLSSYIRGFSRDVREIMDCFGVDEQISRMDDKNLLFQVVQRFVALDLSPDRVDNIQMGYVFEELIRIGAEQANEEAGEHFTPREVIRLMVGLLLSPEPDLGKPYIVKTIYDPACGTGGMLSAAEEYLREHNSESRPLLYGQDHNDEAWAVCKSDMLLKGENAENAENAENIRLGDTFTDDQHVFRKDGRRWTFDYMLANPPFGVQWKQQKRIIHDEHATLGYDGRFGAGLPRINDGALLFLQHMLSKMQPVKPDGTGGSRIAIVFNGSPLFTGSVGGGESNIRRWIIENDWLEAVVALPDQLFYNTGISTYIWLLTNRKEPHRAGKVQLIDGRQFYTKMRKSLGNKRNELSNCHIDDLVRIHGDFTDGETRDLTDEDPVTHQPRTRPRVVGKVFDNTDFGYHKITVERPLRLNFAATPDRIARLDNEKAFQNLAKSRKRKGPTRDEAIAAGRARQEHIRSLLQRLADITGSETMKDRAAFLEALSKAETDAGVGSGERLRLKASERKAVLSALGERDPHAEICRDRYGKPEPDPGLRDTETVPLRQDTGDHRRHTADHREHTADHREHTADHREHTADHREHIEEYLAREVLPHIPDAWVDHDKTKTGYEIPLNRHFYVYEPPRPLEDIDIDLQKLEHEIIGLLAEITE